MPESRIWDGSTWRSITDEDHRNASDPHTQYHTDVRGDARYKPLSYVPAWTDVTGKPSVFPPEDHTHAYADITGKPSAFAPSAHATTHTNGTDDIQNATASQKGLATAAQITKLDAIESGATADQSAAEILAAIISGDPADGDFFEWDEASGRLAPVDAPSGGASIEAWHVLGSGGEPTLQNSWTGTARYRKDADGLVTVSATISGGTATAATTLWTMPSGYRPASGFNPYFACTSRATSGAAFVHSPVQVLDTGVIRIPSNTSVGNNLFDIQLSYYID